MAKWGAGWAWGATGSALRPKARQLRRLRENCDRLRRHKGARAMKLHRRKFLALAVAVAAAPALPRRASAENYPTRPVRIVAGFAAGGGVDITARLIGQW